MDLAKQNKMSEIRKLINKNCYMYKYTMRYEIMSIIILSELLFISLIDINIANNYQKKNISHTFSDVSILHKTRIGQPKKKRK